MSGLRPYLTQQVKPQPNLSTAPFQAFVRLNSRVQTPRGENLFPLPDQPAIGSLCAFPQLALARQVGHFVRDLPHALVAQRKSPPGNRVLARRQKRTDRRSNPDSAKKPQQRRAAFLVDKAKRPMCRVRGRLRPGADAPSSPPRNGRDARPAVSQLQPRDDEPAR